MLEPVLPLFLNGKLGLGPARIGLLFGCAAVASALLHPIYGRLADRWGGRRLMLVGLLLVGVRCRCCTVTWSYSSDDRLLRPATPRGGAGHHAVAGVHGRGGRRPPASGRSVSATASTTWRGASDCSAAPRSAASLFERVGFATLTLLWAPLLLIVSALLTRVEFSVPGTRRDYRHLEYWPIEEPGWKP